MLKTQMINGIALQPIRLMFNRVRVLRYGSEVTHPYVPHVTKKRAPYLTALLILVKRTANPAMLMHMFTTMKMNRCLALSDIHATIME